MLSKKLALLVGLMFLMGCHSGGSTYSDASYGYGGASYQDPEYGLAPDPQLGAIPAQEKSFVDRHPLLSAPRNYYRDSGDNIVVKVLAGTLVGVPVGVAQEVWQIGYGQ